MTALAADRALRTEKWSYKSFSLASGKIAYKGGIAVYDQSAAKCIPAEAQTDLFVLGTFAEKVDATSAAAPVVVQLKKEVTVTWFKNGTTAVQATDVGKNCYLVDDQTVAINDGTGTRSVAGVVWAVDSTLGVAVELT